MRTKHIQRYISLFCLSVYGSLIGWLPPLTVHDEEMFVPLHTEVSLNTAPSFGKTHFIFGYDQEKVIAPQPQVKRKKEVFPLTADGRISTVLFAPDQKICKKLVALIDHEKESIYIAAFMITDKRIAAALCRAHKRGVRVEVVVDPGCVQDRSNKIAMLYEEHIPIYIYYPQSKGLIRSLMHNKFVLFGNTIYNRSIVWTGSANFTCKADEINQENVVIIDDKNVYKRFAEQFNILKQRSERYEHSLVTNAELHERARQKTNGEIKTPQR